MNWQNSTLAALAMALASAILPGSAVAWVAGNSQHVNPVSPDVFEVVGRAGSSNVDYWCAAGDYARRVLDAPLHQRIYLVRGRAHAETENRKSAVQFSLLQPVDADTRTGLLLSATRVGENLSAAMAFNYCLQRKSDTD